MGLCGVAGIGGFGKAAPVLLGSEKSAAQLNKARDARVLFRHAIRRAFRLLPPLTLPTAGTISGGCFRDAIYKKRIIRSERGFGLQGTGSLAARIGKTPPRVDNTRCLPSAPVLLHRAVNPLCHGFCGGKNDRLRSRAEYAAGAKLGMTRIFSLQREYDAVKGP